MHSLPQVSFPAQGYGQDKAERLPPTVGQGSQRPQHIRNEPRALHIFSWYPTSLMERMSGGAVYFLTRGKETYPMTGPFPRDCMDSDLALANFVFLTRPEFSFAVFAMHPRQGERYRLHLAVHHSPACTAVPRTNAYRRNSPSSQWEAVEEVSLSPWGIVAPCPPRQGQQGTVSRSGYAVLAPSCSPLRPTGDCTRNAVYAIVKLRERTKLSSHCS